MKVVAVIFGGKSVEHDISIITAMQVLSKLPKDYIAFPIYITQEERFVTADNIDKAETFLDFNKKVKNLRDVSFDFKRKCFIVMKNNKVKENVKVDCALLCNHGYGGEDGSLQGFLQLAQIPYSSSSISSSALTMDKTLTKIMLKDAHIKSLPHVQFSKCQYQANKLKFQNNIKKKIKFPCIIKPANLGSSVGISICECEAKLDSDIEEAFQYDDRILVEKFLSNAKEFSCAVVKVNQKALASKVCEVKKSKIYTFEDKYLKEKDDKKTEIDKALYDKLQSLAIKSYTALRCDGVVRVDFLFDNKTKTLFVNELNSIPGSLSFNMFNGTFEDLLKILIEESIEKTEKSKNIVYKFNSKAIENYIKLTTNSKLFKK